MAEVYGQEYRKFDFSGGLFLSDSVGGLPDNCLAELINMEVDANGSLTMLPPLTPVFNCETTGATYTPVPLTAPPPNTGVDRYTKCWSFSPVGANDPIFAFSYENGSDGAIKWLKKNGQSVATESGYIKTFLPIDVVQYRDRFYSLAVNGTTINRLQFNTSDITETFILSIPNTLGTRLLVFRDRIFCFAGDRIYYTEIALTGGYPDNWNSGNNFLSLPAFGGNIKNAFVLNDRIYIFTDIGLFQLYATGSPFSWSIQPVSENIRINHLAAAASVKDSLVYANKENVYVFAGGSPVEVGDPIKKALEESHTVSIFPYLEGFLLFVYKTTYDATNWLPSVVSSCYYFNGRTWCQITFKTDGSKTAPWVIGTVQNKYVKMFSTEDYTASDIIVFLEQTGASTYSVQAVGASKLIANGTTRPTFFRAYTGNKLIKRNPFGITRFFSTVVEMTMALRNYSISCRDSNNDMFFALGSTLHVTPLSLATRLISVPTANPTNIGNLFSHEFGVNIYGTMEASETTNTDPFMSIHEIGMVVDTNTKDFRLPSQAFTL